MGKCFFGYPDWGLHSPDIAISSGAWEATLPAANVLDPDVSKVARSVDALAASTTFDIDLTSGGGNTKDVHAIAIFNHNIEPAATVSILGDNSDPAFTSPDYNSGPIGFDEGIFPSGMPRWEYTPWQTGDLDVGGAYFDRGYRLPFIIHFSPKKTHRYWRISVLNTGNNDGFIQIGRVVICSGFSPDINFQPGAALGWETNSESIEADSGRFFHVDRPRRRTFNFTMSEAADDEALVHQWRLMQKLGTTGQLLFIYDIDDTAHMHRRSFLATFKSLNAMGISWGGRANVPMSLVEEI